MPEEDTSQVPTPTTEPTTASEDSPASTEVVPAPETDLPSTQTGQIPPNDPLPPKPDPIPSPSAAAPQAQPPTISPSPVIGPPTGNFIRNLLAKASAKIQSKKNARLEKIMLALTTKNKITNDEVEKLLHVSDATAERYLAALVKEGKIKQDRKTGAGVAYTKT